MKKPTVVCIDDDAAMLRTVVRSLRTLQLEILSTTEVREALDWIALRDIAVLVSDYEMPRMNGIELAGAARLIRPETVRILLTAKRTFDTAVDGINVGEVFRYVNKPFDPAVLCTVVSSALDRHHELVASSSHRELAARRELVAVELEAEHPNLTRVLREHDGVYLVPPISADMVAGLGLEALLAIGGPARR